MAWGSPRKEGDTRWAQEYLLDPLNAVEAYQTAQTGGQYNNTIPTQHKSVSAQEYHSSNDSGIGRSRSLLSRSGSRKNKKEAGDSQDVAAGGSPIRRSTSIREKLMRRFTDDGKDPDRRQRPLRPLNEVPTSEISRMGNTAQPRGPRLLTPPATPEGNPDPQNSQDNNELQNQENRPVSKKMEDRWSNNPYRNALLDAENRENRTPPASPRLSTPLSPTNPFRRSSDSPPSSPVHHSHHHSHHHSNSHSGPSRAPHSHRNSMHRSNGPRAPAKRHSRNEGRNRPNPQRVLAADTIDSLDTSFGIFTFHHEGPYDATLSHRNRNPLKSPVQATRFGNEMALKATLPQDIENSLQFGRPLEGVAIFPPGTKVVGGEVLEYDEYDLNRKDGNYRRYPGVQYREEDLKGKGIEGYDGDLADKKRKEAKKQQRQSPDNDAAAPRSASVTFAEPATGTTLARSGTTAGRLEGAAQRIKRTFSLKRKDKKASDV
ncbi:hypothetical protein TWF694_008533 [Orbilia ellipsospora]|uniref:Pal1 cell morphology protein n=1 Tax=Orbilia ellipsospora TaxID=2528407 RepID=A0AAV9XJT4_9PEZI